MQTTRRCSQAILAVTLFTATAMALAEPGDAQAVARARKDYALALQGHDAGLQNATRVELSYQLAQSRERAKHKGRAAKAQTKAPAHSAS